MPLFSPVPTSQVLPYLEQQALFDRWDFTKPVLGNREVAQTDISMFYCPTRRRGVRGEDTQRMFENWTSGGTDYGGCIGSANSWWNTIEKGFSTPALMFGGDNYQGMNALGVLWPNGETQIGHIRDGTSNTLLVGELQRLWGPKDRFGREAYKSQDGWAVGGVATLFDTACLPTSDVYPNPGGINNGFFESPGSDHPGGANFGFADGSVRFISENGDPRVFEALGSRAGGEVVGAGSF